MPIIYGDDGYEFSPCQIENSIDYLNLYGFAAKDVETWEQTPEESSGSRAVFSAEVVRHLEMQGHTWYVMQCSLKIPENDQPLVWMARRRLNHLRQDLHDRVKTLMGATYAESFAKVPFARHGGVPGTSERLNSWFEILTALMNDRYVPPSIVLVTLQFLEPPAELTAEPEDATATDYSVFACAVTESGKDIGSDAVQRQVSQSIASESGTADGSVSIARWWWWVLPIQNRGHQQCAGPESSDVESAKAQPSDGQPVDDLETIEVHTIEAPVVEVQ